jgi:phosphoserine phosphatase
MFKATKVAAIFDFDKTLSPDYMQQVVFDSYHVKDCDFWGDCQKRSQENLALFGAAHHELDYMNMFLQYVRDGKFPGLDNTVLAKLGNGIRLYPGVAWMFNELWKLGVEIYIVSSGMKVMLTSLELRIQEEAKNPDFRIAGIYACDFRCDEGGIKGLSSIANCVDAVGKTKAVYEISKGVNIYGYDVTISIPKGGRRVPLEQMIYVADGPSDVFAMNLIKDSGGFTMGVFNADVPSQFKLIENIRSGNRIDTVAIADYREGATASYWIINKAKELVEKSSEEYCLRQKVTDLRGKRPGF